MNQIWDANKYADDFSFVHNYGNNVAEFFDYKKISSVLDLGCGGGELSERFYKMGLSVIGLDSSEEMLETARNRYPDINFICADATDFSLKEPVDAVFSNAVFHLIDKERQPYMMGCVYNALSSGGQFVFEMGGIGNNALIHSALAKSFAEVDLDYVMPFYFPSIGEYSSMLEKTGFKIRYAVLFDRPTELNGENGLSDWINMFVNNPFIGVDEPLKSDIIKLAVDMLYSDLCKDGIRYADYVRLRMKAVKE